MSIFGPAGLERNNGTRTDPHSAAGTGTHPGACAAATLPNEGVSAPAGSAARATIAVNAVPTIPDSRGQRIAYLPLSRRRRGPVRSAGERVALQTEPTGDPGGGQRAFDSTASRNKAQTPAGSDL